MPRPSTRAHSHNGASGTPGDEPDVYLNVPDLEVEEIKLDVENLEAHLALQTRLANLLELRAGAHVTVEKVELEIKGVAAKAMLKVRLENVRAILDRALTSIDRNPQILEGAIRTAGSGVSRGKLARLGGALRSLPHPSGDHRVTKLAVAAGLLGGGALAARGNGGIEKTIKDLTS
jgi:hypothetical protein